eukprot:323920_1
MEYKYFGDENDSDYDWYDYVYWADAMHDYLPTDLYDTTPGTLINFYLPVVAYFNATIFMFDGYHSDRLMYDDSFDADDSFDLKWIPWRMANYGELALFSQSWTQIHDKVYFIGPDEEKYWLAVNWELTKVIVELDLTTKNYTYLDMWGFGYADQYNYDMWEFEEATADSNFYHGSEMSSLCDNITHLYHIYRANRNYSTHSIEQTIHIYNIATSNWTHSNESVFVSDSTNCQIYQPSQTMYIFGGR